MFTISETLQINAVIWIRSLPEEQRGPSNRIIEDLIPHCVMNRLHFEQHEVKTTQELDLILSRTASAAVVGLRPIIHFDGHGSPDHGLRLSATESYSWPRLADQLRIINRATQNNLSCVFATCYGYHICRQISLSQATPFYLLLAPPEIVHEGFLEAQTMAFYRRASESSNITRAYRETLSKEMMLYHCQGLFLESLATYVAQSCTGEAKRLRFEDTLTRSLDHHGIAKANRQQLRKHRGHIKKGLKPGQKIINHYAPTFLIGRTPQFSYQDVSVIAKLPSRATRLRTTVNASGRPEVQIDRLPSGARFSETDLKPD